VEWVQKGGKGLYRGVDFSSVLLAEAGRKLKSTPLSPDLKVEFEQNDLTKMKWLKAAETGNWDGVMAFAVLHHIPDDHLRVQILKGVQDALKQDGLFIYSVWQFQNSGKWLARRLDWSLAGIDQKDLEEGDTLLDWKHTIKGQPASRGLRYVHLFSHEELTGLAEKCGFEIIDEFDSDGEGGKLGLYQIWKKK